MDLPLKSQAEIHAFFEVNAGCEFVDFTRGEISHALLADRLETYHFFQNKRDLNPLIKLIEKTSLKLQQKLKINRLKKRQVKFQKGSLWFSITHEFALYLIEHTPDFRKYFHYSKCADELFVQTVLLNSPYLNKRFFAGYNDIRATMRFIDWDHSDGSSPNTFGIQDLDMLLDSNMLFARKFNDSVDAEIIQRIATQIRQS